MPNVPVILDIGEFASKIGFGSENEPRYTFFTLVGEPKYKNMELAISEKEYYVGNEVSNSLGLYKITRPIYMGQISDWPFFKAIIDYAFYQLKVDPTIINILYITHPLMKNEDKKRIIKMFFDQYQVAGFYPVLDALLTMYSGGFQTGLVVEMGASSIRIVPIFEGFKIDHAIKNINIGGTVLDAFMQNKMNEIGWKCETSVQKELLRVIKERTCFVSLDFEEDLKNKNKYKKSFSLPDGDVIELTYERFLIPELFFKPELFNLEETPLHIAILDSIEACDIDLRTKLLNNIFLSGGTSCFPQLEFRLQQELEIELIQRGKQLVKPRIIAPKKRMFSPWIGGSILSTIPEFQSSWLTRVEYYNNGIPEEWFS
ncbi:MAG: actin family protein [Promethearchaeota archaeon]